MKKSLLFVATLVAMVLTMSTFSSCAEEVTAVVVRTECGIGAAELYISDETRDALVATKGRIDARLNKLFGKEFEMECDEDKFPEEKDFEPYCKKIRNDGEIRKEMQYLSTLTTIDDQPAVSYVVVYFMATKHELAKYLIPWTD